MTQIITWEYIMSVAKQCGKLRQEGKEEEANEIEEMLKQQVATCDKLTLNCTVAELTGEKKRR